MNCSSQKCRNIVYQETICNLNPGCDRVYCCKNCLYEHQIDSHKQELAKKSIPDIDKRKLKNNSIFMKQGFITRDFIDDPKFEKQNFEFVKMGSNYFNLGSGAFGDVYLAKNKIDGNFYAIKKVTTIL